MPEPRAKPNSPGAGQFASRRGLENSGYRTASRILLAMVALAALGFAAVGNWFEAAALAGLAGLGIWFSMSVAILPSIFTLLFVIAAAVNAFGYILRLWSTPVWFDELVHLYTSFTISAAIGWLLLARSTLAAKGRWIFAGLVLLVGVGLGLAWEGFEWLIGIIGGRMDTIMDLLMDAIGAASAGLFCAWVAADARSAKSQADVEGASGS